MPSPNLLACCLWATALAAPPTVEVVLSHFHEDVAWVDRYSGSQAVFTIYSKALKPPKHAIPLPNVGREAHTYLHHIVRNYGKLADWTVFSQAIEPSWGYHGGGPVSGHLTDAMKFDDYLKPMPEGRDSFFPFSAVSQFPSGKQLNRMGFMTQDMAPELLSKGECPAGGADGWSPWWWDRDHPQLKQLSPSDPTMLQFYHRYIAKDAYTDQPLTLVFVQGARFAVSKARVHRRPREYYIDLLGQLSGSAMPIQGYWIEAAWFDVFHPEALQSLGPACALPPGPPEDALSIPEMEEAVKQKVKHPRREGRRFLSSATIAPTAAPTAAPSAAPSIAPSVAPTPAPSPSPSPASQRVVAVEGKIRMEVESADQFVNDTQVMDAIREEIAAATSTAKEDVEVTMRVLSRRLESKMAVRRLATQTVEVDYKIRTTVDSSGRPLAAYFNAGSISSKMRTVNPLSFATAVVDKIKASSSPLANSIQSISVVGVTAETKITVNPVDDNARRQAALALAYLVTALAALVPVLTWRPLQ